MNMKHSHTTMPDGAFGIQNEAGWMGAFTREQALGAIPNGSRIVKQNSEPGDAHPDGTLGIVLGSLRSPVDPRTFYFVEWEPRPRTAVGTMDFKVRLVG